jgi:hypothetical protein
MGIQKSGQRVYNTGYSITLLYKIKGKRYRILIKGCDMHYKVKIK